VRALSLSVLTEGSVPVALLGARRDREPHVVGAHAADRHRQLVAVSTRPWCLVGCIGGGSGSSSGLSAKEGPVGHGVSGSTCVRRTVAGQGATFAAASAAAQASAISGVFGAAA